MVQHHHQAESFQSKQPAMQEKHVVHGDVEKIKQSIDGAASSRENSLPTTKNKTIKCEEVNSKALSMLLENEPAGLWQCGKL